MTKKIVFISAKLLLAVFLLWLTFRSVNFSDLWEQIRNCHWSFVLGALALQMVAYFFGALRWWILLAHSNPQVSFQRIQSPYHMGLFFGQFLPSSIGGDAVRIGVLYKQGISGKSLVSSSLMDRIFGLIILLWLGLISMTITGSFEFQGSIQTGVLVFSILVPVGAVALFMPISRKLVGILLKMIPVKRLQVLGMNVMDNFDSYRKSPLLILNLFATSLLLQLTATGTYYALSLGIGIEVSFLTLLAIVSIVYITASLPISIGGLGVRENVFVYMMVLVGVGRPEAAALAVLFLFVLWTSVIPGLLFFLLAQFESESSVADSVDSLKLSGGTEVN